MLPTGPSGLCHGSGRDTELTEYVFPWCFLHQAGAFYFSVHNTAASTTVTATKSTSAATKNTLVGVVTTKKASLVAVTTKNTSVATQNAAVVAVTKNTSVVAMATKNTSAATKNTSVLVKATKNALAATKNTSVMAMTTKNASAATKNGLVVVASTKEASAATKNTSVVVVTNNASLVATNTSVKGAEETMQTCQSFQCSGERCYQDAGHANRTTTCHNETYCELYRFSSTNYTARCSGGCSVEPCSTNSSVSRQQCALECCAGPLCLQLNASAYGITQLRSAVEMGDGWGESWRGCGCTSSALSLELGDLPPTTTSTVPLTATTTTTPRPPPQNVDEEDGLELHGRM
ncbi:mucin-5AC-like [Parus major]|uniref:mucin-5AC-like n=1 Tax=Parus major TaxID=9157 RepID=UPI00144404BB|nr:mucin-5AC-like [Parus major]